MKRRSHRFLRFATALAAVAMAGLPAAGRDVPEDTFTGTAQVLEVEIPVNVLSKEGQPIRGLSADSFEVFDNGVKQEITGFRVVDLGDFTDTDRRRMETELPPPARRRFFMVFDTSFSDPTSITKAREAAQRFVLESLHPTDLVAVAVHSLEEGAQLLVTFTTDRAQVVRAIETLGLSEYLNSGHTADPLRFIIDPAADPEMRSSGSLSGDQFSQQAIEHLQIIGERMARTERAFQRTQVTAWSRSLGEMAGLLKGVQGRKHVVLLSEGFDGRLLLGRQPSEEDTDLIRNQQLAEVGQIWRVDTDQTYGNSKLKKDIAKMIEQFERADCVIQAVDIAGLTADGRGADRNHNVGQDALFFIANETGGTLFEDANDFDRHLDRVLDRSQVTYLVAFQAQNASFEGDYHRLKIKGPKGARLSYRDGYYEPAQFQDLHPLEKSLLAGDAIASAETREDISFDVIAVPFRGAPTVAYLPVIVEIDGRSLMGELDGGRMPVEIYAYPTDAKGRMPTYFSHLLELDLDTGADILKAGGVKYYGHLVLETGEYLLRVLVRNSLSGTTGVKTIPVSVPRFDEEQVLLQPLFMEEPGRWVMVREQDTEASSRGRVYPFTVNGEPFVPAARPSLKRRGEADLCLVAYGMDDRELELDSQVMSPDGTEIEGGHLDLVERTVTGIRGLDKLVAKFRPQGLATGSYELRVALTDAASGQVQVRRVPFAID